MKKLLIIIASALLSSCTAPKLIHTDSVTVIPDNGEAFTLDNVSVDWYLYNDYVEFCPAHDSCFLDRRQIKIEGNTIRHQQKKAVFIYE